VSNNSSDDVDLVVVGSGAGGLAAAVTARKNGLDVLVVEKESFFGGTTARSGGWLWIPCNRHEKAAGIPDSPEAARQYLQHEAGNHFDSDRVDAFLENGPQMVEFFEKETSVQFFLGPAFSDYHTAAPGSKTGGRSICAQPFNARALGSKVAELRPPLREITLAGMMIGSGKELLHFFNVTRSVHSAAYVARILMVYALDRAVYGRSMRLTNGNALVGRLAKSAFDLGVPIWTSAPARSLLRDKAGRVNGVVIDHNGVRKQIEARRGVVLACGGFPQDTAMRKELFPHAPTGREHWSPAPPGNTGDGLRLARAAGGGIDLSLPNAAAWVPVSQVPWPNGTIGVFPHFVDRGKPGIIAVTRQGTRFVNEANAYHDFIQAMVKACRGLDENAAFLICDHPTLRHYGLGFVKPFPLPLTPHLRSGYLLRGRTLVELATQAGIDPQAFTRTIGEFNADARRGVDSKFGRGTNALNLYLGDPAHKPNPCVAPIEKGPFYAVKVVPGDLGTFAGIETDKYARVLNAADHTPIPGLYAVGNDMLSIMGGNYPGGGITLGPAMTFGYIAGRHAAGVSS
jgi:succinate dehydrogenase/fumarate reductase flavoprotein subunit